MHANINASTFMLMMSDVLKSYYISRGKMKHGSWGEMKQFHHVLVDKQRIVFGCLTLTKEFLNINMTTSNTVK